MLYREIEAPAYLSRHIESYWELHILPDDRNGQVELLLPNCTFNIIFTNQPLFLSSAFVPSDQNIHPGATFIGQRNRPISFSVQKATRIFGVRFKPFAFANILKRPIYPLNDQFCSLGELFDLDSKKKHQLEHILTCQEVEAQTEMVNTFLLNLFESSWEVDQTLRAQINFILERKGILKINQLLSEFGVSKVTLRKHFINKVGLTPKQVSRIWRMNYFFMLKECLPEENLTSLSLMAEFYDQAHFIREFKSLFACTPRRFFQQKEQLLRMSQQNITRRFAHRYDPR